MIRVYGVLGLVLLVVWLYALFEAITSDGAAVRNLGKGFWIVIILLTAEIGAVLWFIAGRPRTVQRAGGLPYKGNIGRPASGRPPAGGRGGRGGRPLAPDDDPDFLRGLGEQRARPEDPDGPSRPGPVDGGRP